MSEQEIVLNKKSEIASLLTHTDVKTETSEKPSRKFQ